MNYTENCKKNFPAPAFREGQEQYLIDIAKALDGEKRFIFFQGATGIGKSNIGFALARCNEKSVIHTSMNTLVSQYVTDKLFSRYGEGVFTNVKGRANYTCPFFSNCETGTDSECDNASDDVKDDGSFSVANDEIKCGYKRQKKKAVEADVFVTNSTYYAMAVHGRGGFPPSYPLVIADEAHKLPGVVLNLVSLTVHDRAIKFFDENFNIKNFLRSKKLKLQGGLKNLKVKNKVIQPGTYYVEFDSAKDYLDRLIASMEQKDMNRDYKVIREKDYKEIREFMSRVYRFKDSIDNDVKWLVDLDVGEKEKISLSFRPIHTYHFSKNFFSNPDRGSKFIFMSATIVDPVRFAHDMGIDEDDYEYIKSPIIFPAENRPAYFLKAGSFSYRNMKADPKLKTKIIGAIEYILKAYPNKRGIIHCGSYTMAEYIKKSIKDERLSFPKTASEKKVAFKKHEDIENSVIVSPAVTEGIDMKDDLARFQIMLTIPYPSLSDRRVKERMEEDPEWYALQASYNIVQAYGRGVRSAEDTCDFYYLDSRFPWFIKSRSYITDFFDGALKGRNEGIVKLLELKKENENVPNI